MLKSKHFNSESITEVVEGFLLKNIGDKTHRDTGEKIQPDKSILKEYMGMYFNSMGTYTTITKSGKIGFTNSMSNGNEVMIGNDDPNVIENYGTGLWAINLMNELNLLTIPMKKIENFEKKLNKYINENVEILN